MDGHQNNVSLRCIHLLSTSLAGLLPSCFKIQQSPHYQVHVIFDVPYLPYDFIVLSRYYTHS